MKLFHKALPFVVLSSIPLFAAVKYTDSGMRTSITHPGAPVPASGIQNPQASYSFNTFCTDIGSNGKFKSGAFQVTKLRHRADQKNISRTVSSRVSASPMQYIITCENEAEYRVTCGNGLSYSGKLKWTMDPKKCKKNCKDDKNWKTVSLNDYNASTGKFRQQGFCKESNRVPLEEIFEQWNARKVSLPELRSGSKKLSRPVVFVPGHNSTFTSFGAKPLGKTEATNPDFLNGRVSGYANPR